MHVLVTGACGYKGTVLVPKLLTAGYRVTAFDIMWFGNYLVEHDRLRVIKGDIRDTDSINLNGVDVIIHLASVANDPCGDIDPKLTWEISALATMQLAAKARLSKVKQFIYASSGSVYGIKDEDKVTEDLELVPISEYNKTKMVAERILLSYVDDMIIQIIRPATVCGYSPRMRLDVSVNMLTMQSLTNKRITVFGGQQTRPNIHIDDITDVYLHCLSLGSSMQGIFNAGFENLKIIEIGKLVSRHAPSEIVLTESNDPRSYRIDSGKLLKTGFKPKKNVEIAIKEITEKYQSGALIDEEKYHNLKWMEKTVFN